MFTHNTNLGIKLNSRFYSMNLFASQEVETNEPFTDEQKDFMMRQEHCDQLESQEEFLATNC